MRKFAMDRWWQRCHLNWALALLCSGLSLATIASADDQSHLPLAGQQVQRAGRSVSVLVPWIGLQFGNPEPNEVDADAVPDQSSDNMDANLSPDLGSAMAERNSSFRLVSTASRDAFQRDGASDLRRLPNRLPELTAPTLPVPAPPRKPKENPGTRRRFDSPASVSPATAEDVPAVDAVPRVHPGVVEQARGYIDRGILQAERGAVYASRTQFIKVLRLISQSLDAQTGSRRHSIALARGLTALDEAADFRPTGSRLEAELDLRRLVLAHETTVLHRADFAHLTPLAALQAYHVYAEKQLAMAGGHELAAADALYGLAKLQKHLQVGVSEADHHAGPTAMSLYQAALMIYPEHYMAANELGVLFARFGQYRDAVDVLEFAARTNGSVPETWLNLAKIHARLGDIELAQRAEENWRSAMVAANRPLNSVATSQPRVEWLSPDAFAQLSDPTSAVTAEASSDQTPQLSEVSTEGPTSAPVESRTAERRGWSIWPFR